MAVELAALIPVVIIAAALAFNVLTYLGCCARFDRVAAEAVRVYGVSPGYGSYGRADCAASIEEAIEEAFEGSESVGVTVSAVDVGSLTGTEYEGAGLAFSLIPSFRKYTCTLTYTPRVFGSRVFGAAFPPATHECTYIVDPFKATGWL